MNKDEAAKYINSVGEDTIDLFLPEPVSPAEHKNWEYIMSFCKEYNITGSHFAKFIYFCCDNDQGKIFLTIDAIRRGLASKALVNDNLDLYIPVSFIADNIQIYKIDDNHEVVLNPKQQAKFMERLASRSVEEEQKNKPKRSFFSRIRKKQII